VLQVTIRDSGAGFSPGDGAGFGLAHSIHGRIAEVGGRATVNSSPGLGTKVTLRVPL
jgi:signal transduction histidine kinase